MTRRQLKSMFHLIHRKKDILAKTLSLFVLMACFSRALIPVNFMLDRDPESGSVTIILCPGMTTHKMSASHMMEGGMPGHDGAIDAPSSPAQGYELCPFAATLFQAISTEPQSLAVPIRHRVSEISSALRHQTLVIGVRPPLPPRAPPARA